MNKKAFSHIEIILSFVIFVSFLIFLAGVFKPFEAKSNSNNNLNNIERAISNHLNGKISFFTINIDSEYNFPGGKECFDIRSDLPGKIIAKNETQKIVNATSREISGLRYFSIQPLGKFYYIYLSPDFIENSADISHACDNMETPKRRYSLGLLREYTSISINNITVLKNNYTTNYEGLKTQLDIKSDFGITIRETSGNLILNATKNSIGKSVYAKDIPVTVVYSNGTLLLGIMNIKTW